MDGVGGSERDDREHPAGWTAPIIDAPIASGAADTEPGTASAGWGSDDWAWTEFDEATPDFDEDFARSEEPPTAPDVPVVPAAATLAVGADGPTFGRSRTSRDGRRRRAIGIGVLGCFAILVGALVATMGGGSASQPKRADTQHSATTGAPATSTTTSTTLAATTVPTPATILSSATVVTRPPAAPTAPPTSPSTCNIVTQLLGCH